MENVGHVTNTGVDNRKLGMWVIIASECMLFASLLINYGVQVAYISKSAVADSITPQKIINVPITSVSTFVLLMSSVAMVLCLQGIEQDNLPKFRRWCFTTASLGALFLAFQVYEFSHFYLEGLGFSTNTFGSAFFSLTGTHGAHVLMGVIILTVAGLWSYKGSMNSKQHKVVIETIGLYWHFVDVIWIIIFTVVYLFVLAP